MPFLNIDNASRVMMAVTAVILGFVWWNSSFERRQAGARRQGQSVDRSEAIGRGAGRIAGNIARVVRDRSKGRPCGVRR